MKIKEIKIREDDGSYSDPIPMGADAINIDTKNGSNLETELTNINNNLNSKATQITNLGNKDIELNNKINSNTSNLQSQINGLTSGTPLPASSIDKMTDTSKIYVNITDGYWYYYNDGWKKGEIYQGIEIENNSVTPEKTTFLSNEQNPNLFYWNNTQGSHAGIDYVIKDGLIILNGTATEQFELWTRIDNFFEVGETYSWETFTRETSPQTHMTRIFFGEHDFLDDYYSTKTFVSKSPHLQINTYVFKDQTVNNLIIKPFVVKGDSVPQYYFNNNVFTPINKLNNAKSTLIVAKDGTGDYSTIQEAVNNAGDTPNSPVTIVLKPGIYEESIWLREKRNLSFIGVNKDKCIWINKTGVYANCPLYINGDFLLQNITFKMTLEKIGDWLPTYDNDPIKHDTTTPGYALHVDYYSKDPSKIQVGRIINCSFYSEAYPAVGSGIHQNQFLIFENCEFIRKTTNPAFKNEFAGAFLCHCSQEERETNQNLIIKNCTFNSNYAQSAWFAFAYAGGKSFNFTSIGNSFFTSDTNYNYNDIKYNKGASTLNFISHGNNNSLLNYDSVNSN